MHPSNRKGNRLIFRYPDTEIWVVGLAVGHSSKRQRKTSWETLAEVPGRVIFSLLDTREPLETRRAEIGVKVS